MSENSNIGTNMNCLDNCADRPSFLLGLPLDKQQEIMGKAVWNTYPRGSFLFAEEDRVDGIYMIRSGRVKLSTWDSEGREQIVGIFSDSDIIWEGVFMEGSRYPYSAICLTEVECSKLDLRELAKVMEEPSVALRVIALLSNKLHDANERVLLLSTTSPKARLAGFLLNRSRHTSSDTVVLKLEDIAASIQLRPETVSRRIRELEKDGIITKTGQSTIQIGDRKALEEIFRLG